MQEKYTQFDCDVCNSNEATEIPHARLYTNDQPIHVCKNCGNVYVRARRRYDEVANDWSKDLFGDHYNARIPAITARLVYVAEFLDTRLGLRGKTVCDIGAGEGQFLDIVSHPKHGAKVFGIEPSKNNCNRLSSLGHENFCGPIEAYAAEARAEQFDVVTMMWTLECCSEPRKMLDAATRIVKSGGHVLVATGSRILVPFKKPLWKFLSPVAADTHTGRYSANTLTGLLATAGFKVDNINQFIDSDILVVTAGKMSDGKVIPWQKDDWRAVVNFFQRWHQETEQFYPKDRR